MICYRGTNPTITAFTRTVLGPMLFFLKNFAKKLAFLTQNKAKF
jgi:hypothetical protein